MIKFRNLSIIFFYTCLSLCFQLISTVGFDDGANHRSPRTVTLRTKPEKTLQSRPGALFKIALFADLHFGEDACSDWGPRQDVNSISHAIAPTRARGIPWATVSGNHDDTPFEWPIEWFSPPGIPQVRCPLANSSCPDKL
ncbi:Metallo-dependent phosphatase-like [Trema orientale]|uniref:Metallo-dependent phosphatase-like n=1 Tax=Trema orientale TaxID=63057 RepID=A0A2P5CUT3_TREOI|nr:Metallo-dependent phosphatase-like [Trema orientale]